MLLLEAISVDPWKIFFRVLGKIFVVFETVSQPRDWLGIVGARRRRERHAAVTDLCAIGCVKIELCRQVADRSDQTLLAEVGVKGHAGYF